MGLSVTWQAITQSVTKAKIKINAALHLPENLDECKCKQNSSPMITRSSTTYSSQQTRKNAHLSVLCHFQWGAGLSIILAIASLQLIELSPSISLACQMPRWHGSADIKNTWEPQNWDSVNRARTSEGMYWLWFGACTTDTDTTFRGQEKTVNTEGRIPRMYYNFVSLP